MSKINDEIRRALQASRVTSSKMRTLLSKDSDRDGVPNIFDCKPYNPNEQGLSHYLENRRKKQEAKEAKLIEKAQAEIQEEIAEEKQKEREAPDSYENLGGDEGKIHLYIKTGIDTYSQLNRTFNSRIEAEHFAENNYTGKKYKIMNDEESKFYEDNKDIVGNIKKSLSRKKPDSLKAKAVKETVVKAIKTKSGKKTTMTLPAWGEIKKTPTPKPQTPQPQWGLLSGGTKADSLRKENRTDFTYNVQQRTLKPVKLGKSVGRVDNSYLVKPRLFKPEMRKKGKGIVTNPQLYKPEIKKKNEGIIRRV